MARRRVNLKAILADQDLRRELMVPTIQAVQAREGIETTRDQAERAYYVVNEADKSAFFDLERFRGGKRSEPDRREEMFIHSIRDHEESARFDVARRDFAVVDGSPLAFQSIRHIAPVFRDFPSVEPAWGIAQGGASTAEDERLVRFFWEVSPVEPTSTRSWERFSKGGSYCRFYQDIYLRVAWSPKRRSFYKWFGRKGRPIERPESLECFFKPSLVWSRRSQRGFSVRVVEDSIFSDKSGFVQPSEDSNNYYLLGVLNSRTTEYLLSALVSFGSFEVGVVKRLPVPRTTQKKRAHIGSNAEEIHNAKASWDLGNEVSTRFKKPWFLHDTFVTQTIPERLDDLAKLEASEEARIQRLYAELNDEVYKLYGIPDTTRSIIEETLGERPPEALWPQMEGKSAEQKRMEHVWRLLSYAVKRVVDADEDGIVPFMAVGGETALVDRVSAELAALFPDQDINRVEVDITNELRRRVKGYRAVQSIREWLEDVFFDYHVSLYKKRPILWHIASSQGRGSCAVGALCHYHKFDRDRLAKLRGSYLRDAISLFRREAGLADQEGRTEDRQEWQAKLEEAQSLDQRLQWVQEGQNGHPAPGDCRIRTPWKSEDELPSGWQPDIDDGVAVNILPLQTAGVLRIAKVV